MCDGTVKDGHITTRLNRNSSARACLAWSSVAQKCWIADDDWWVKWPCTVFDRRGSSRTVRTEVMLRIVTAVLVVWRCVDAVRYCQCATITWTIHHAYVFVTDNSLSFNRINTWNHADNSEMLQCKHETMQLIDFSNDHITWCNIVNICTALYHHRSIVADALDGHAHTSTCNMNTQHKIQLTNQSPLNHVHTYQYYSLSNNWAL